MNTRTAARRKPQAKRTDFRSKVSTVRSEGASRWQNWFDQIFKAQSIHFYRLLGVTLFLVIFGVVMVLSASSVDSLVANNNAFTVFFKQFASAALGLFVMAVLSGVPTHLLGRLTKSFFVISIALQVLVLFVGKSVNGNRNWISIFGLNVQPSEFIKLSVILFVAYYLASRIDYLDYRSVWMRSIWIIIIAMGSVVLGRDLGTMIIMGIAFFGLLILAGLPSKLVRLVVVISALAMPVLVNLGSTSRMARITAWLNPGSADPNGYNWQSEHGVWAISAGRIFGAGLGESKMKWSWIPEVENDYIFAIIAEELGLIGALVVIALFVVLAFSLLRILQRTDDPFGRFVVGGVMIWIIFQALINIAVVLRLLPVLGIPLPLISAGGSSVLATLAAIGVVLSIERQNHSRSPISVRPRR